jgi:hypothetical protein
MAYLPEDGSVLFTAANVLPYVNQGESFIVGGGFSTTPGVPSQQLLPSTNATLGYYNGQMLATAAGGGTGIYAGLTAGAMVNFDPASDDAGQAVWNGYIICDAGIQNPLAIHTTYAGTIQCAVPLAGWTIKQQFLYAGGTPATDVTVVNTAVTTSAYKVVRSQVELPSGSGAFEAVFKY